jgi:hypothetical protein
LTATSHISCLYVFVFAGDQERRKKEKEKKEVFLINLV